MGKVFIISILIFSMCGCTNPYNQFYTDYTNGANIVEDPNVIIPTDKPKLVQGYNAKEDTLMMMEDGYILLGESTFGDGEVNQDVALSRAEKVHAETVIVYGTVPGRVSYATFWIKGKPLLYGFYFDDLTYGLRKRIGSDKGVYIPVVVKKSPAFNSGLLRGDIICKFNNIEVIDTEHLNKLLDENTSQEMGLEIFRNGKTIIKKIKLSTQLGTKDYVANQQSQTGVTSVTEEISNVTVEEKISSPLENIKMDFVLIPTGEFIMGSNTSEEDRDSDEGPVVHKVRISKPFYMDKFEVTRGQFSQFVSATGYITETEEKGWAYTRDGSGRKKVKGISWRNPGFSQDDSHPVVCVSWNDAKAFCDWLSGKEGKTFRLPTEAEWEYVCRANTSTRFSFAGGGEALSTYGNYTGSSTNGTESVGSMKPNAFGLYDMHGNVWEWCSDWYDSKYYAKSPPVDPTGPGNGKYRVLRGGCWYSSAKYCRSANRSHDKPNETSTTGGFRVILDF